MFYSDPMYDEQISLSFSVRPEINWVSMVLGRPTHIGGERTQFPGFAVCARINPFSPCSTCAFLDRVQIGTSNRDRIEEHAT